MGMLTDYIQNNFSNGELAPGAEGRSDINKYPNSVKFLENWLIKQLGGVVFRPGTGFLAETKTSSNRARLLKFIYSTTQSYAIEAGDLYFRFFLKSNGVVGQLTSGGSPVELVTPFAIENVSRIKYTQNADTMFIFTGVYPVYKLTRTSATTFTITQHDFKRGPFLAENITSTTITPSAATGATTLTASSGIFQAGHVGSYWRIRVGSGDGVVKITSFTSATQVSGTVQAEPDGVAGNLGGTSATTFWSEGAFSEVRGYPSSGVFHEGRLWVGKTSHMVGGFWATVPFEYDNMDDGEGDDDDAIWEELAAGGNGVPDIRWMSSGPKNLQFGTSAGPFTISSGSTGVGITPQNVTQNQDNEFGSADIQGKRMFNRVYYAQNNLRRLLESGYFYDVDQNDVDDATLLADHILDSVLDDSRIFYRGDDQDAGAYDMDTQQSPNNRLWVVRNDGQISVLIRNPRQEINGWSRIRLGKTISCDGRSGHGLAESIVVLPQDGDHDVIFVIANRVINGVEKRFVEYFTKEDFKYPWEPVRLDSSLTLDEPIEITDIDVGDGETDPVVITAPGHGLTDGMQIRLDNIVGSHQLNEGVYLAAQTTVDTLQLAEVT